MIKPALFLTLIVTALASMPAHAQRVFVSGLGVDTNPCTVNQPCRTFQQAYNTVPANGEINVLDPGGYGVLTITHGISIQGHGFGSSGGITVSVTTSDPVTLNGLVLEGLGTASTGISITSGPSVQILNSVVRHFQIGINAINATDGSNLLIEDTVASDNSNAGIFVVGFVGKKTTATLNRITANNNQTGIDNGNNQTTIANSVLSNNNIGLDSLAFSVAWLAKTVISGNTTGLRVTGTVNSYGDNYVNSNTTPVMGSLTPVGMQ